MSLRSYSWFLDCPKLASTSPVSTSHWVSRVRWRVCCLVSKASQWAATGDAPNETACHCFRGRIFILWQPLGDSLNAVSCSSHKVVQGVFVVYNSLWCLSAEVVSTSSEEHTFPRSMTTLIAVMGAWKEFHRGTPRRSWANTGDHAKLFAGSLLLSSSRFQCLNFE